VQAEEASVSRAGGGDQARSGASSALRPNHHRYDVSNVAGGSGAGEPAPLIIVRETIAEAPRRRQP
jgi:hypothetical protein